MTNESPSSKEEVSEIQMAKNLANLLLDEPYADPDDDKRVLARQLLRRHEDLERLGRELAEARRPGVPMTLFDALAKEFGDIKAKRIAELIADHNRIPPDEPLDVQGRIEELGCLVATRLLNDSRYGGRMSDKEAAEFGDAVIAALEATGGVQWWPKRIPENGTAPR